MRLAPLTLLALLALSCTPDQKDASADLLDMAGDVLPGVGTALALGAASLRKSARADREARACREKLAGPSRSQAETDELWDLVGTLREEVAELRGELRAATRKEA